MKIIAKSSQTHPKSCFWWLWGAVVMSWAVLARSWSILASPWGDLGTSWGRSLQKSWKSKNWRQYNVFATFLESEGSGWSLFGTVLSDLGHKFGYLGPSWRQVVLFFARCWYKDGEDEQDKRLDSILCWSWLHFGRQGVWDLAWHGTERARKVSNLWQRSPQSNA